MQAAHYVPEYRELCLTKDHGEYSIGTYHYKRARGLGGLARLGTADDVEFLAPPLFVSGYKTRESPNLPYREPRGLRASVIDLPPIQNPWNWRNNALDDMVSGRRYGSTGIHSCLDYRQ